MPSILDKILRLGEGKILRQLKGIAAQVNALEESVADLSDEELRAETESFKERVADGESLDALMPEAFAVVREAAKRTLGQRPFDVQIQGGAALHLGNIAEMKTGEGKTLVATLPAYLNALAGKGVHVVTVNDYLAQYQSELMGRVFRFLGMTTGVILSGQKPAERREMYAADITYGTNNEFGFDYLRDNMAWGESELVQRGHNMAVVDEVDSILIDEARTPLIISGPASGDVNKWYVEFARMVRRLTNEVDYEVDEKKRTVGILEPGIERVEDYLGIENLYESLNTPLIGFLNNAVKAKELFTRDKDYVVLEGELLIVDQHTGRILPGRRYNEGMHQALEAKEGVQIKAENQTLATITLQNYFRRYDKLAGMTGTAMTEAAEFQGTYEVGVVPIPPNRPLAREDRTDIVYKSEEGKFEAVVEDIVDRHAKGQPVLVGTTSVEKSERLSKMLKKRRVPHEVLNAKHHEREAAIVAMAGRKGAVTVATNMAGRGTDIMLGGNAEHLAIAALEDQGLDPNENPEEYEAAWPDAVAKAKESVEAEHDEVTELGGLYVLGTERHESRRIDNQLRGRSGRQGDPGESRFYLSLEDELMRLFNTGLAERFMSGSFPDDQPLEFKMIARGIESAQGQVERRNFEIRKNVLKYDDVLSRQREVVYETRHELLEGEDLKDQVGTYITDVVTGVVSGATSDPHPESWDLEQLWTDLRTVYPVSITEEEVVEQAGHRTRLTAEELTDELVADAKVAYATREEELTPDVMRQLERRVVLSVLDRKWREHLYEMDYLKEGIGLRAMAQRDPLVEYQREGYQLFQAMDEAIKEESVGYLFNLEVKKPGEDSAEENAQAGDGGAGVSVVAPASQGVGADDAAQADGAPDGAKSGAAKTGGSKGDSSKAGKAGAGNGGAAKAGSAKTGAAKTGATQAGAAAGRRAGKKSIPQRPEPMDDPLGLGQPERTTALRYSAPSVDGDSGRTVRGAAAGESAAEEAAATSAPAAGGANREARRRAAKAAKKRG